MVTGILPDNNCKGHFQALAYVLQGETWAELWGSLNLTVQSFAGIGLTPDAADDVLWQACQKAQVILVTSNRNQRGPDSLETTIRALNGPDKLPVFTLSNAERIVHDRAYAEKVAERLLDYLLFIDKYKGTGRIYLP
jgi:hypothetical protein